MNRHRPTYGKIVFFALVWWVLMSPGSVFAVEQPAPTDPTRVFHIAETIEDGGKTYYIPDPGYNVWPGPHGVDIEWTAGSQTVIYSYDAASEMVMEENVYLVDVRTPDEWIWVGHPGKNKKGDGENLAGRVVNISLNLTVYDEKTNGHMNVENKFFDKDLIETFAAMEVENPSLITLCRSGHRSVTAGSELTEPTSVRAAKKIEALGGFNVYNMLTGFEGGTDPDGYRTLEEGWRNLGLPYNNSMTGAYGHPGM